MDHVCRIYPLNPNHNCSRRHFDCFRLLLLLLLFSEKIRHAFHANRLRRLIFSKNNKFNSRISSATNLNIFNAYEVNVELQT